MTPTQVAVVLGFGIVALGVVTGGAQIRGLLLLNRRKHVPSDEAKYLRGKHRRRLVNAVVLLVIGGMVAGAYVSGLETRAERLGQPRAAADAPRPPMSDEDRLFVRVWSAYWLVVVALVFVLVMLAFSDAVATRRYWLGIYRELRDAHQAELRRDLAVHRQHQQQNRAGPGRLGPVGGSDE